MYSPQLFLALKQNQGDLSKNKGDWYKNRGIFLTALKVTNPCHHIRLEPESKQGRFENKIREIGQN